MYCYSTLTIHNYCSRFIWHWGTTISNESALHNMIPRHHFITAKVFCQMNDLAGYNNLNYFALLQPI